MHFSEHFLIHSSLQPGMYFTDAHGGGGGGACVGVCARACVCLSVVFCYKGESSREEKTKQNKTINGH